MTAIAVYNMKGGVGKTTTSVNLAHISAAAGQRTLLWDLDPQAAASFALRVRPRVEKFGKSALGDGEALVCAIKATDYASFDLLPADFAYRKLDRLLDEIGKPRQVMADLLAAVGRDYEVVVLDCPPGFSLLTEGIFAAVDAVLVPALPNVLSLRTVARVVKRAARSESSVALPVFFNMVDRRKTLHRRACELATHHPDLFLAAQIPYASVVEQMGVRRMPLGAFAGRDAAAAAFEEVWRELQGWLAPRPDGQAGHERKWESSLKSLESMMECLERGTPELKGPTGLRLLDAPRESSGSYLTHVFDTERRRLARAGLTVALSERAGAFFVVATAGGGAGPQRTQVQIDASWAREILSEVMSPIVALERRLGESASTLLAHVRSAAGGRALRRIESAEVSPGSDGRHAPAEGPTSVAPDVRQAG